MIQLTKPLPYEGPLPEPVKPYTGPIPPVTETINPGNTGAKAIATQVKYPGRATIRTIVAVLISTISAVNILVPIVVNAAGNSLPASTLGYLNGLAITIAAISGAITRIMAIPQVNEWLKSLKLSATK
jgi:hypothetical protein